MKEIVIPSRSKSIRGTVKRNCSKWAKYSGNNSRYTDFVNQRAWNLILLRVSKLRKEVSEIDLKEIHNLEDTFSALTSWVQEQIDALQDLQDTIDDEYQPLIDDINDYNDAVDRTNELLELQKNLKDSLSSKERVYREGSKCLL